MEKKRIIKVVVAVWILVAILSVIKGYELYQWHELEKVEHEVDLMYDLPL